MKPYILIVEDDPDLAEGIRYNLDRNGLSPCKSPRVARKRCAMRSPAEQGDQSMEAMATREPGRCKLSHCSSSI